MTALDYKHRIKTTNSNKRNYTPGSYLRGPGSEASHQQRVSHQTDLLLTSYLYSLLTHGHTHPQFSMGPRPSCVYYKLTSRSYGGINTLKVSMIRQPAAYVIMKSARTRTLKIGGRSVSVDHCVIRIAVTRLQY